MSGGRETPRKRPWKRLFQGGEGQRHDRFRLLLETGYSGLNARYLTGQTPGVSQCFPNAGNQVVPQCFHPPPRLEDEGGKQGPDYMP